MPSPRRKRDVLDVLYLVLRTRLWAGTYTLWNRPIRRHRWWSYAIAVAEVLRRMQHSRGR